MDIKRWIIAAISLFLIAFFIISTIYMTRTEEIDGCVTFTYVSLSVESHEDTWEITIDEITRDDESISSISTEGRRVQVDVRRESVDIRAEIRFSKIKNNWSEEYSVGWWEVDGDYVNNATIRMNSIIWNDIDGDGKISIGDRILIEKEGGSDSQLLPGDTIGFLGGDTWSKPVRLHLPNHEENQTYVSPYDVYDWDIDNLEYWFDNPIRQYQVNTAEMTYYIETDSTTRG